MATKVLIVDDELPLLRNLASYLGRFPDEFEILTAPSAEDALATLSGTRGIELLLTDVRMPGIDGIELVRRAVVINPTLSIIVMTAFPSTQVRKQALAAGAIRYLEKPLDIKLLRKVLLDVIDARTGWSGKVGGLDIFDFTQLFVMSGKSTSIRVRHGEEIGVLGFREGNLVHAATGSLTGDEAFYQMTTWEGGKFEEITDTAGRDLAHNITSSTSHLMIEAARIRDEARRDLITDNEDTPQPLDKPASRSESRESNLQTTENGSKEDRKMAIKDHLAELQDVAGFMAAAVFTAQGQMLEGITKTKVDIKSIGMFANNALLNAQKATDQMGVGRGNMMQIRAPQAEILMRCLNEATDFSATKAGKAHFHTVVLMDPEGNTGMAAMILDKIQAKIADEVR
jgi:CheY-like chemotaxis protein